jgi:homoserine/homoserine lactone efflux protein
MLPDPLFLLIVVATVASPGPGVLLTLTNALRCNRRQTLAGIVGIAAGALVVASLSAAGLGVLLATSALAFSALKLIGAVYLLYLAVKLWNAPPLQLGDSAGGNGGPVRRFTEGISVQLTNPKVVFFYMSVFPQFVDPRRDYVPQFAVLVLSHCFFILLIHSAYALTARWSRPWLATPRGGRVVNRLGAATFAFFGAALATARR